MRVMCALTAIMTTAGLAAQEGTATLPQNYRLQFENAWVKVTAVRYGPQREAAGPRTHAESVGICLPERRRPGDLQARRRIGRHASRHQGRRVPRLQGLEEVHEVENTSSVPSEFLRVELKTEGRDPASFRGKFERPTAPSPDAVVHLDHPQARMSRFWLTAGQKLTVQDDDGTGVDCRVGDDTRIQGGPSNGGWRRQVRSSLVNSGPAPVDFLRCRSEDPASHHKPVGRAGDGVHSPELTFNRVVR